MTIIIKPLEKKYLADTIQLGQQVFSNDDPARIAFWLEDSLNLDKEAALKSLGATYLQFWIAVDNDRVVGGIGYYVQLEDIDEAVWVGWFFVDPEYRGKKIGFQLLETVIGAVKKTEKRYLRVYSSSHDSLEKRAQQLYERRGFVPFREPAYNPFQKEVVVYLQLDLKKENQS
jgi:GNAT superfamily N-acetyltransferase